jgi:hypothetical protein
MDSPSARYSAKEVDLYQDVLKSIHLWWLSWLKLQDNLSSLNYDWLASTVEEDSPDQRQSTSMISSKAGTMPEQKVESVPVIFGALWTKHVDDEKALRRKVMLQRQQSIDSLQETGVGSFDHLNGLTLEQLQEMERLVHEHDANSYYGEATTTNRNVLPILDWLDMLCT